MLLVVIFLVSCVLSKLEKLEIETVYKPEVCDAVSSKGDKLKVLRAFFFII
jgi:hypothetical protein